MHQRWKFEIQSSNFQVIALTMHFPACLTHCDTELWPQNLNIMLMFGMHIRLTYSQTARKQYASGHTTLAEAQKQLMAAM